MPLRIPFETIHREIERVLLSRGVNGEQADLCARIIASNSIDGVTSHGVTRFPHFISTIDDGLLQKNVEPEPLASFGAIERWDGKRGLGPVMATRFMARATELAAGNGIGCVAAQNTTHWLRGGTYGLQAAEKGFAAICFTNARPAMPAWGGKKLRLGNNPIVFAVPGNPPLLADLALSQFSYGKIQEAALAGKTLPVAAGYALDGEMTNDPQAILESLKAGAYRLLPMGYWKGSALSFIVDAMVAILSGGFAAKEVETASPADVGISQVFIAFDVKRMMPEDDLNQRIAELVSYLKTGRNDEAEDVRFPGEGAWAQRSYNLEHGAPVDETVWAKITSL